MGCNSENAAVEHSADDWKTYNYNALGSRYNAAEKDISVENAKDLEIKWQFHANHSQQTIGAIHATPVVVNGYTYFGTATYPMFYKITPDGKIRWQYEPGNEARKGRRQLRSIRGGVPRDGIFSSALVTDNSVYFGDIAGVAYCLDRKTGKEKWTVDSRAEDFPGAHAFNVIMASPIIAGDKIIFAGGAPRSTSRFSSTETNETFWAGSFGALTRILFVSSGIAVSAPKLSLITCATLFAVEKSPL